jgi:hypothetical protein
MEFKPEDQLKKRRFRVVAPSPYYYQMDIAFFGKDKAKTRYMYLIFIGVNNRYTWATRIADKSRKSIEEGLGLFVETLSTDLQYLPSRIYVDGDGERSFKSLSLRKIDPITGSTSVSPIDGFVVKVGQVNEIDNSTTPPTVKMIRPEFPVNVVIGSKPDTYHNRLSIINRIIRTIRDYAYKRFKKPGVLQPLKRMPRKNEEDSGLATSTARGDTADAITPEQLAKVLKWYNNRPHRTLSRLAGFNVSPSMLLDDVELEGFIAKKLMFLNLLKEQKRLSIDEPVMVAHKLTKAFEKKRYNMEPGEFKIVDYKNNMYKVENKEGKTFVVPGFYLAKYGLEN